MLRIANNRSRGNLNREIPSSPAALQGTLPLFTIFGLEPRLVKEGLSEEEVRLSGAQAD